MIIRCIDDNSLSPDFLFNHIRPPREWSGHWNGPLEITRLKKKVADGNNPSIFTFVDTETYVVTFQRRYLLTPFSWVKTYILLHLFKRSEDACIVKDSDILKRYARARIDLPFASHAVEMVTAELTARTRILNASIASDPTNRIQITGHRIQTVLSFKYKRTLRERWQSWASVQGKLQTMLRPMVSPPSELVGGCGTK